MKKHLLIWVWLIVLSPVVIYAQSVKPTINSTLSGKIIDDKTKAALPGAVVHIKGTTHEVVTGEDGQFNFITGQKLPYTLVVSYVGYKSSEFTASKNYIELS